MMRGVDTPDPHGLSRRGFLKGVGAGTAAAGLLSPAPEAEAQEAAEGPRKVEPEGAEITLKVNGEEKKVTVEPRTTLLDALRNRLDITGAKKVCDRATCGACTVMLDGQPLYSCTLLALEAEGREITTAEGLGSPEQLAPIHAAFIQHDAQQCGFCTPGFVVASAALLKRTPNPSAEEVHAALGGNLCRCGTYAHMVDAVLEAAKGGA